MTSMTPTPLSQLATVSAGQAAPRSDEFSDHGTPFVRAGSLDRLLSGAPESSLELVSEEIAKRRKLKTYPKGTVLFAKSGMSATKDRVYVLQNPAHVVSHLATLIPKRGTHEDYLRLALKHSPPSSLIKDPAYPSIGLGDIKDFKIPVPDSSEDQTRIAHLLGKVEGLIAQRKQHLQYLDDLLKSVFLEMFGDPVRNERGWETQPFSKIGKFTSGGTPSKSRGDFWAGEFPWVSPKDMKVPKIFDSEDHVSAKVFDETSLKRISPGHLLIVVRGMILAHSFPVAINMVDVAINQDMKAIKVNSDLRTAYVFHCLNALKRQILKLITTAGHGTKKFDSDVMAKLLIPVPTPEIQDRFLLIADKIEGTKSGYLQSLTDLEALYGVLSQQAFKGELDLSRVPLPKPPTQHITHVSIGDQAVVPEPVVQAAPAIDLPASDKLPAALESTEARKGLIAEWLEAYRQQLGDVPFSVQDFMVAASDRLTEWLQTVVEDEAVADEQKNRLAEFYPSNDVGLDVNDYEHIKKWVFEALVANRLAQSRNVTGYDEQSGEPIFGNLIELKASQT